MGAAKMDSSQLLDIARTRFAKGLWESSGWGSGDRRCIVGTLRDASGQGIGTSLTERKDPEDKKSWHREPYFTTYEEVIFACASIIDPGFDPIAKYKAYKAQGSDNEMVAKYKGSGFSIGHGAILAVLDEAEHVLIGYNDSICKSADEMVALMEEATKIVKQQRDARMEEWSGGGSTKAIIDAAIAAGAPADAVVLASAEDGKAAEEEYRALRMENPDLPPIWTWFSTAKSKKDRKKAKDRVVTTGLNSSVRVR